MGQIYAIINKINGKCYVGQTINTFCERYGSWSGWANEYNHNPILKKSAQKYGLENFTVVILENGNFTIDDLNAKEEFWAKELNSYAPEGYNIMGCGNNRRHSDATREKLRILNTGRKATEKQRIVSRIHRGKRVICSDGRVFMTMRDAAKETGVSFHVIQWILSGHYSSKTSLMFAFDGEDFVIRDKNPGMSIQIKCSNGKIYQSVREASRDLNIPHNNILKVMSGKNRHAHGYTFCKIKED